MQAALHGPQNIDLIRMAMTRLQHHCKCHATNTLVPGMCCNTYATHLTILACMAYALWRSYAFTGQLFFAASFCPLHHDITVRG